ncbi:hypothetical protein EV421DRAFT_1747137 [Armillaria borealis]|uniref:Uncharacterized protein n=1 Tax=Armillaria borealis TaxID=47425 RepID=A0AA39IDF3_9AGAR|nr:hypothetical protein EV421DRAFT_1747137 [Armillaria borealis]
MHNALDGLRDMEASVFHSANYLITQVTICTPFQEKAMLAIFEPFRDAVVDFLNPVIKAWSDVPYVVSFFVSLLHQPTPDPEEMSWIGEMYHSIQLNAQLARNSPWTMWARAAALHIEMAWDIVNASGYTGQPTSVIIRISHLLDEGRIRALNRWEEISRRLYDLSQFAVDIMQHAPYHSSKLGWKGSEYRKDDTVIALGTYMQSCRLTAIRISFCSGTATIGTFTVGIEDLVVAMTVWCLYSMVQKRVPCAKSGGSSYLQDTQNASACCPQSPGFYQLPIENDIIDGTNWIDSLWEDLHSVNPSSNCTSRCFDSTSRNICKLIRLMIKSHVQTNTLHAIYDILEYRGYLESVCPGIINDILQEIKDNSSEMVTFSADIRR